MEASENNEQKENKEIKETKDGKDVAHKDSNIRRMFKKYLKNQKPRSKKDPRSSDVLKKDQTSQERKRVDPITKVKKIEDENEEVFEVVKGGARPARCSPLKARKLKWKEDAKESLKEDDPECDNENDSAPEFDGKKDAAAKPKRPSKSFSGSMGKKRNSAEPRDGKETKEVKDSKDMNIEESKERRSLTGKRSGSADGGKAPNEPGKKERRSQVKKKKKLNSAEVSVEDELDENVKPIALRVAEIMKRNQLLERVLPHSESMIMVKFFSSRKKPDDVIFMILDKAITSALDIFINRPHEIEDAIDNQMRQFVMDRNKAKTAIVELVITTPDLIPIGWGGGPGGKALKSRSRKSDSGPYVPSNQPPPPQPPAASSPPPAPTPPPAPAQEPVPIPTTPPVSAEAITPPVEKEKPKPDTGTRSVYLGPPM